MSWTLRRNARWGEYQTLETREGTYLVFKSDRQRWILHFYDKGRDLAEDDWDEQWPPLATRDIAKAAAEEHANG